jgi:hypothetical protein
VRNLLILAFLLSLACEGKTGPIGPEGPAGRAGEVSVFTGTFAAGDLISGGLFSTSYWQLSYSGGGNLNDAAITVHTRAGSSYAWGEPSWTFDSSRVFIFDDEHADPGWQWRVAIVR